jgi:hypothetical protein
MTSTTIRRAFAGAAIVAAMAFGAKAIVNDGSSATAAAGQFGPPGAQQGAAGAPQGVPPGMGTPVTGSTLTELRSVVTAKYPGSVERAMKLTDGSYVVHVIESDGSGEVHVLVSKALKITGTQTGGPPPGAQRPV